MEKQPLSTLPWGLCPGCLDRMASGGLYESVKCKTGETLTFAYCEHREVGATLLTRPGRPLRWQIQTPIDIIEWEAYRRARTVNLSALFSALAGTKGAGPGGNPPAEPATN